MSSEYPEAREFLVQWEAERLAQKRAWRAEWERKIAEHEASLRPPKEDELETTESVHAKLFPQEQEKAVGSKKSSSRSFARYREMQQKDPTADPMSVLVGMDAATFSHRQFGLYNVPLNVDDGRFGTVEDQMADAEALGAGILRENGDMDLTWKNLSPFPHLVPKDRPDVVKQILGEKKGNIKRLKDVFIEAQSRGIRLILRCPMGDDRKLLSDDGDTYLAGIAEPLKLKWSSDHPNASVGVDNEILDITNAYHREYLGYMMEGIAQLLRLVAQSLGVTSLSEYVYALEIFPNVDDRNVVPLKGQERWDVADPEVNGRNWGYTWWYVANILWDSLAAPSELPPLELPFLLPAISSHFEYEEDGTRNTLSYNLNFFSSLCYAIQGYTRHFGGTGLDRMAFGVNYRWYHRNHNKSSKADVPREGPKHMGHLKREITMVKDVLDRYGLSNLRVFVLDTGISVNDSDEFVPDWMTDRDTLQAYEVWRRVAGALACGASVAGWQSWMSTYQDGEIDNVENYGMGLRNDNSPSRLATRAWPRSSWFAYRRMVETLSPYSSARLIYPVWFDTNEPTFIEVETLLIYRFVSSGFSPVGLSSRYAYLLLPDITAPNDAGWNITINWSMASPPADAVCTRRRTFSTRTPLLSPERVVIPRLSDLPYTTGNFDDDVDLPSLPQLLTIYVDNVNNEPILLLSNYELVFDIKYFPLAAPPRDPRTPRQFQPYPIDGSGVVFPDLFQNTVYVDGVEVSP